MSVKLMTAVWESALPYNIKMVALAYADSANDDGYNCIPSIAYIAWKTGYSTRAVQLITRHLEHGDGKQLTGGILQHLGQGPHGQNAYRFHAAKLPDRIPWGYTRTPSKGGANPAPHGANPAPQPDQPAPEPVQILQEGVQNQADFVSDFAPDPKTDPKEKNRSDLKTTQSPPPPPAPQPEPQGGVGGGGTLSLEDAFELAGILNGVRTSIAKVWESKNQTPLQPIDIIAWHLYAQNNKVGPGAIVRHMQFGERPIRRLYTAAEAWLEQFNQLVRDIATWIDEDSAWDYPDRALADTYFDPTVSPGYRLIVLANARKRYSPTVAAATTTLS